MFRLLDLVSYVHTRRGNIYQDELAERLPGWDQSSVAGERRTFRDLSRLRSQLGVRLEATVSPGGARVYVLDRQTPSPWLSYARGQDVVPPFGGDLPDRQWTAREQTRAIWGVLRMVSLAPRGVPLTVSELIACAPFGAGQVVRFVERWQARGDLRARHHQAVQFLTVNAGFWVHSLW